MKIFTLFVDVAAILYPSEGYAQSYVHSKGHCACKLHTLEKDIFGLDFFGGTWIWPSQIFGFNSIHLSDPRLPCQLAIDQLRRYSISHQIKRKYCYSHANCRKCLEMRFRADKLFNFCRVCILKHLNSLAFSAICVHVFSCLRKLPRRYVQGLRK